MCILTKEIHYLCPSKPFIRDSINGICGIKPMTPESRCATTITPRSQVHAVQAEIVGNRWLVSTGAREAILTYDRHDTSDRVPLPDQTFWADVPSDAILHVEDTALFHLSPDQYESEIELPEFFAKHTLELDPSTLQRIQYEGTQQIDIGPIENVLKEIRTTPLSPGQAVARSWSASDTILITLVCLSYLLTSGVTYLYFRRTRQLQANMNSHADRIVKFIRRKKSDRDPSEGTEASLDPVLIELNE